MSKFCGTVGYGFTKETSPGVYEEVIEEKDAIGDMINSYIRQNTSSSINPKIVLNNTISIILDSYMLQNYNYIKFIRVNGVAWNVESIDIQHPRLIIKLGGEYHEQ